MTFAREAPYVKSVSIVVELYNGATMRVEARRAEKVDLTVRRFPGDLYEDLFPVPPHIILPNRAGSLDSFTFTVHRPETFSRTLETPPGESTVTIETPKSIFIAEYVDDSDNVWDGRSVHGVHTTLEGAVASLSKIFDSQGDRRLTAIMNPDHQDKADRTYVVVDGDTRLMDIDHYKGSGLFVFEKEVRTP